MTDAQLLRAVLSLSAEFEGYTDENQKSLSYYGQKNGKSVLCVLDTLQRANENRFVMYVNDLPEASYQSFPEPGCRVKIDNGWTAMVENGQLYVGYDYDPSGNCMWSLSSGSGNPGDLMEEYFEYLSSLYGSSVTAERKDEVLTVAGGSDVTAASFTLHGMPADLFCMYASWETKDGRTWQMTVSAYSYDLPTVRFVVGRMLEDIVLAEAIRAIPYRRDKYSQQRVFKLVFPRGEFDMVLLDPEAATCRLYEIKHTTESDDGQLRHLTDHTKLAYAERTYGTILSRTVLYRGSSFTHASGIEYVNVGKWLKNVKRETQAKR